MILKKRDITKDLSKALKRYDARLFIMCDNTIIEYYNHFNYERLDGGAIIFPQYGEIGNNIRLNWNGDRLYGATRHFIDFAHYLDTTLIEQIEEFVVHGYRDLVLNISREENPDKVVLTTTEEVAV